MIKVTTTTISHSTIPVLMMYVILTFNSTNINKLNPITRGITKTKATITNKLLQLKSSSEDTLTWTHPHLVKISSRLTQVTKRPSQLDLRSTTRTLRFSQHMKANHTCTSSVNLLTTTTLALHRDKSTTTLPTHLTTTHRATTIATHQVRARNSS